MRTGHFPRWGWDIAGTAVADAKPVRPSPPSLAFTASKGKRAIESITGCTGATGSFCNQNWLRLLRDTGVVSGPTAATSESMRFSMMYSTAKGNCAMASGRNENVGVERVDEDGPLRFNLRRILPSRIESRGIWSRRQESNLRPSDYKSDALPAELRRRSGETERGRFAKGRLSHRLSQIANEAHGTADNSSHKPDQNFLLVFRHAARLK